MLLRFVTGISAALLLIFIAGTESIVLTVAVSIVAAISLLEVYHAIGLKEHLIIKVLGVSASTAMIFDKAIGWPLETVLTAYIILLVVVYLANYKSLTLTNVAQAFFLTVYIGYFLAHIIHVRNMEHGQYLVWFTYIGAFVTDTFAYLVGISIGKHKLAPDISPKKTVEGCVGGIIGCVFGFVIFGFVLQYFYVFRVNFYVFILLGVVAGAAAVVGDLVTSLVKRQYSVKDFSSLFPGHGGFLDRSDSMLLVAPLMYLLLKMFAKYLFV